MRVSEDCLKCQTRKGSKWDNSLGEIYFSYKSINLGNDVLLKYFQDFFSRLIMIN